MIFVRTCRIVDYWVGKTRLDFGVEPTQNGELAAILDLYYNVLSREC